MSNNYDEYEYDDNDYNNKGKDTSNILNKIGIMLMIIIAIIIIVVLINGCSKKNNNNNNGGVNGGDVEPINPEVIVDYDSALLNAGKKYFENNRN